MTFLVNFPRERSGKSSYLTVVLSQSLRRIYIILEIDGERRKDVSEEQNTCQNALGGVKACLREVNTGVLEG